MKSPIGSQHLLFGNHYRSRNTKVLGIVAASEGDRLRAIREWLNKALD